MNNLIELPHEKIMNDVLADIKAVLSTLNYGSIEIVVQDGTVTQISTRYIRKTNFRPKKKTDSYIGLKNGLSEKVSLDK